MLNETRKEIEYEKKKSMPKFVYRPVYIHSNSSMEHQRKSENCIYYVRRLLE